MKRISKTVFLAAMLAAVSFTVVGNTNSNDEPINEDPKIEAYESDDALICRKQTENGTNWCVFCNCANL